MDSVSTSSESQESNLSDSFDGLDRSDRSDRSGELNSLDLMERKAAQKPRSKRKVRRVGIVDDERCDLHVQTPNHQESPDRVKVIREKLQSTGLYNKLIKIDAIEPSREDLLLVHTNRYINKVARTCTNYDHAMIDTQDVIVNGENSLISASISAGSVLAAVIEVVSGRVDKVFCNIRPPGHHASSHKASGFCIFNNVALGAKKALAYPGIGKVLILDWDLHHGDGTESIFKCSKNVMFASFHRGPPFWPSSGSGVISGKYGNIHNYPQEANDIDAYMKDFYGKFLPAARAFKPDMIFISCGFDGHKDDFYEALPLDYDDFKIMTKEVCKLANECCDGRLISVLEGGYTLSVLKDCAAVHINELLANN